jgi:hypothetical protein
MNNVITRRARRYALEQLAARAGADASEWAIDVSDRETCVYLDASRTIELTFPVLLRDFDDQAVKTGRCSWPEGASPAMGVPDFVVPFCPMSVAGGAPLFVFEGRRVRCQVDLPASVLYSLCRIEERLSPERDQHGRFSACASDAFRKEYLYRPIVDEYGLGLAEAIARVAHGWQPRLDPFRAWVTQDVDSVGIPFDVWSTASRLAHTHSICDVLRDAAALFRVGRSAELKAVTDIARLAAEHGFFSSASFWKLPARGRYDTWYDLRAPLVFDVISDLRRCAGDIGFHPSYETFANRSLLAKEAQLLREWLGQDRLGGRQHYLRWSPDTWRDWESCGLAYDSSLGFPERPGFRAGTARPYHPWLVDEDRQANLIEIPLILMDRTLSLYMRLSNEDALALVLQLLTRTRAVGGVFTLLWHNSVLLDPQYRSLYQAILEQLDGAVPYDPDSECWTPHASTVM